MLILYWDLRFFFADFCGAQFGISCVMQMRCGRSLKHILQFRCSKSGFWVDQIGSFIISFFLFKTSKYSLCYETSIWPVTFKQHCVSSSSRWTAKVWLSDRSLFTCFLSLNSIEVSQVRLPLWKTNIGEIKNRWRVIERDWEVRREKPVQRDGRHTERLLVVSAVL